MGVRGGLPCGSVWMRYSIQHEVNVASVDRLAALSSTSLVSLRLVWIERVDRKKMRPAQIVRSRNNIASKGHMAAIPSSFEAVPPRHKAAISSCHPDIG